VTYTEQEQAAEALVAAIRFSTLPDAELARRLVALMRAIARWEIAGDRHPGM
jgi:hypothetical protein